MSTKGSSSASRSGRAYTRSKAHIWCNTFPGHNDSRYGAVVNTGASKATCDLTGNPVAVSVFVDGSWQDKNGVGWNSGTTTIDV